MTEAKKTRSKKNARPSDAVIIAAIKGSGGIMSTIARRLKVEWHTAQSYVRHSIVTVQALQNEEETALDLAESTLLKAIKNNDVQAAKWLLSTKGKRRGYSEKHEIDHSNAFPVQIRVIGVDKQDMNL